MTVGNVNLKSGARNHKGFFLQKGNYQLIDINRSGWALICLDDAVCHYVDPDDLQLHSKSCEIEK